MSAAGEGGASTADEARETTGPGDIGGGISRDIGSALNGSLSGERFTPPDEGGSHNLLSRPGHQRQGSSSNN